MKGLSVAPLTLGDAARVGHVWRACELHDDGEALITEADFVAASQRPSMDLERHTVGVRDGAEMVAVAVLYGQRDAFVHVLPSHRGRGIGAWLLRWTQEAGRAAGHARTSQRVSENEHAARTLLEADGYERQWEDWIFELELEHEPGPPRLPPGYAIRTFVADRDGRAVHRTIEDAFAEWPDAEPGTFEDWVAETVRRPGFAPEHIGAVVHDGAVVGAAVLIDEEPRIWVAQLAVAREHRGRGLARALLVHAFGVAWRSGRRHVGLGTDSRTGARGLYEHVGMHVTRTAWEYGKRL